LFDDVRSKKVIFIAHCLLNQNSISDGTAVYPAGVKEIINLLVNSEIGIIQLPCPELLCLGLDRGNINGALEAVVKENSRIRKMLENENCNSKIESLSNQVVLQILEYKKNNFDIKGIIGLNRSPSCGVETTSKNNLEVEGFGVFMERLIEKIKSHKIKINVIGIKPSEIEKSISEVKQLIGN